MKVAILHASAFPVRAGPNKTFTRRLLLATSSMTTGFHRFWNNPWMFAPTIEFPQVSKHLSRSGWLVRLLAFAAVLVALTWRITIGVDLSDESYYAIFIDDWLKGSIASSTFLTVHQTAALIVYPAARLYTHFVGSTDGLILFLRVLYVAGALAAAGVWYRLVFRLGNISYAWVSALACLAFIPFGLPAPSYNTIGLQALLIGLAAFGCATTHVQAPIIRFLWLSISALAWGIAVVAHPAMIFPLVVFCLLTLAFGRTLLPSIAGYLALVATTQVVSWGITLNVLSWSRLKDSVLYLAAINDVGGIERKFTFSLQLILGNPFFAALLLAAIVLGLIRKRLSNSVFATLALLLLVGSNVGQPALFLHSHDLIALAALTGLGLLVGFSARASPNERIVAILYAVSMAAGAATAAAATYGPFNFCIGAAPAALLSVCTIHSNGRFGRWLAAGAQVALLGALLHASLIFYYGEIPGQTDRRTQIEWGAFAGIAAQNIERELLTIVRDHVRPLIHDERTILVIGRVPGLTLATNARPRALTTFPLSQSARPEGINLTRSFYENEVNRPHVVVIYIDPYSPEPLNPIGARFHDWYAVVGQHHVPPAVLTVFLKRPHPKTLAPLDCLNSHPALFGLRTCRERPI